MVQQNKLECLTLASFLQGIIIFVGETKAQPSIAPSGAHLYEQALGLSPNIRPVWKKMSGQTIEIVVNSRRRKY